MNKFNLTALSAAFCLALSTSAIGGPISKAEHKAAKEDISAKYKSDMAACKAMTGNAKDICVEEAKGREKVAKAELEANYSPSDKHRHDVRMAKADAAYAVAKKKCDDSSANAKEVCLKEAKGAYVGAKADATLGEKTADANATAREKTEAANATARVKTEAANATAREKTEAANVTAREKTEDANATARAKTAEARRDAAAEKTEAATATARAKTAEARRDLSSDGKVVFEKSCKGCHSVMKPKMGDKEAWAPLIKQGPDALTAVVMKGKAPMPPKGGAASEADVKAAVEYMLSQNK